MTMAFKKIFILLTAIIIVVLVAEVRVCNAETQQQKPFVISELTTPTLAIQEGLISQRQDTVLVKRGSNVIGRVILSEPVIVAQADKEEKWGFFQFSGIYREKNGHLIVSWQMNEDSYKSYGKGSGGGRRMSVDEGKTWQPLDRSYFRRCGNVVELRNGDLLRVTARPSKDISKYDNFPKPVNTDTIKGRMFYRESELPADLRGNYITYRDTRKGKSKTIHGNLHDPGLLRYAINGLMPVLWLGDIRLTVGDTLVTGVYPANYLDAEGRVLHSGISFYKSGDNGYNWIKTGTIPYHEGEPAAIYNGDEGFSEPAFVILKDGTYLCVIRTGFYTPMYKSISKDGGYHWSKPEPFTSNGVSPNLLLLDNGVLVLASGRPGVQLRFNMEGDGDKWTEPIEMLPFLDKNGKYGNRIRLWPTCGYTGLMAVDDHTFYFVWSDFKRKNKEGKERKTILFRKVEVVKESPIKK